ncbi:hypothetical protein GGI42DRAFT_239465 [Trichoderma sp. SZMC 28013]
MLEAYSFALGSSAWAFGGHGIETGVGQATERKHSARLGVGMRARQMDSLNCSCIEARFCFGAYFDANVDARFRFFSSSAYPYPSPMHGPGWKEPGRLNSQSQGRTGFCASHRRRLALLVVKFAIHIHNLALGLSLVLRMFVYSLGGRGSGSIRLGASCSSHFASSRC